MRIMLWRRTFFMLLMILLFLTPAVADAWTKGTIDAPKLFSNFYSRAIAIDGGGNPHIAYGEDHLYYAYHDGSSWNYETVDSSTGTGQYTSIALDSSDNAHISYYDWTNGNLMYATNASGTWAVTTVDSSADVGVNSSIALDSSGKVHISYYDWDNLTLKYATNASGSWTVAAIDSSGDVGLYSSIGMDSSDKAHISYYDYDNGYLKYATNASGTWTVATIDSSANVGLYTSMVLDSSDSAHISYHDWSSGDLRYATNSGVAPGAGSCTHTDWDCETVDSAGTAGLYSSIAMDSSYNVHISYYDSSAADLKYATNSGVDPGAGNCTNTDWDCETVDGAGAAGLFTSIAMDSSNNAHISYYHSSTGELKYATNASGSWTDEAVDSSGDAGSHTSIALDSAGKVHVSYYDDSSGDLKYVTNATGPWVTETVESLGGNVGKYTSIAIDSSDKVHISYYDGSNGDLKHATNADGSWDTETVDGSGDVGTDTAIAIDSSDNIHISYYDWDNWDLKYATNSGVAPGAGSCTNADWDCETLDSNGDVGEHTSIAIDSSDKVHISYYKFSQLNLKYATNASGSWTYKTVDNKGDVGLYTSIAVDSLDNAYISYYDWDNGDLKYATNATGSWVDETVDSSGDVGLYTSIAIDSSDYAHISYYDYDSGDLKYTTSAPVNILTVNVVTVGGSVNPDCSAGCWYDSGTIVILSAEADPGYYFDHWTGCDSSSGNICTMTVDADKIVTATFLQCPAPVMNYDTSVYYETLQEAYDEAGHGETIWSQELAFTEDLYLEDPGNKSVTLKGGYNCDYSAITGNTVLNGNVIISNGVVTIENYILQ